MAVAPVLTMPSAWLVLLRIAAAGATGITLSELRNQTSTLRRDGRKTLRRWERAGLISVTLTGPTNGSRASQSCLLNITPLGLRLLRLPA
jgi:hypothetical protein